MANSQHSERITLANDTRISVPLPALIGAGAVLVLVLGFLGFRALLGGENAAPYRLTAAIVEPTIDNRIPADQTVCPRGGRSADDATPLPDADFTTPGERPLEALFAPGQVAAFEFAVTAGPDAPVGGTVDFEVAWPRGTASTIGFDEDLTVLCAFVDTADRSTKEGGEMASAIVSNLPPTQEELRAEFAVQGLDPGDQAVIEAWLVLPKTIPSGGAGAVETRIVSASGTDNALVDLSAETLEYRIGYFDRSNEPVLQLGFIDDGRPDLDRSARVDYVATVTNTSGVVAPAARLDIFLDEATELVDSTIDVMDSAGFPSACSLSDDGVSCELGFLNPNERVTVLIPVAVKEGAETQWTNEDDGCSEELRDICGVAVATWQINAEDTRKETVEQPSDLPSNVDLGIVKLVPDGPFAYPGQDIVFTYRVTNGSEATRYSQLVVTDNVCREIELETGDVNSNGSLDPGESWDYGCILKGINDTNNVSESRVSAIADDGRPVNPAPAFTELELIAPEMTVRVQTSGEDPSVRIIEVVNSGDASLNTLALNVADCGDLTIASQANGDEEFAPGERWTWTCDAESASEIDAIVYATDQLRNAVSARSDA